MGVTRLGLSEWAVAVFGTDPADATAAADRVAVYRLAVRPRLTLREASELVRAYTGPAGVEDQSCP
jgi:hypothetical protein